jgi:hypothetical protein
MIFVVKRLLSIDRSDFRILNHVREQGANRFESGAYTLVCEHFGLICNAAIEH